jgi:hypothetical protein
MIRKADFGTRMGLHFRHNEIESGSEIGGIDSFRESDTIVQVMGRGDRS